MLVGETMFWLFSTKPRKTVYAGFPEFKVPISPTLPHLPVA